MTETPCSFQPIFIISMSLDSSWFEVFVPKFHKDQPKRKVLAALKVRNFLIRLTLRKHCFELYYQRAEYNEHSLSA